MALTTVSPAALAVAAEVEYRGHASGIGIIGADLARSGHQVDDVTGAVAEALEAGLISEVPRLGGWVATTATKTRVFGRAYAEAWTA